MSPGRAALFLVRESGRPVGGGEMGRALQGAGGSPSRPAGRPRDTALDAAIREAAARQLAECGYAGMSIKAVAAAAGTTPPSVRRRFGGKLDLALAGIGTLRTEPLPERATDPRADALALLRALQATMASHGRIAVLGAVLAEEHRHPALLAHYRQRLEEPLRERLRSALAQGVRDRQLPPSLDLDAAVSMLTGSCYACYLHGPALSGGWAERTLGIIWPPAQVTPG